MWSRTLKYLVTDFRESYSIFYLLSTSTIGIHTTYFFSRRSDLIIITQSNIKKKQKKKQKQKQTKKKKKKKYDRAPPLHPLQILSRAQGTESLHR